MDENSCKLFETTTEMICVVLTDRSRPAARRVGSHLNFDVTVAMRRSAHDDWINYVAPIDHVRPSVRPSVRRSRPSIIVIIIGMWSNHSPSDADV